MSIALKKYTPLNKDAIPQIIFTSFLIISITYENRAVTFGTILGWIVYWAAGKRSKLTMIQWLLLFLLLLLFLSLLATCFKANSSAGRLLIYKVSAPMFESNWIFGIGWGNFQKTYMYYQAEYFSTGHYNNKELLLADNTYYAFNDYYQLIIELGLIGVLILLLIAAAVFCSFRLVQKQGNQLERFLFSLILIPTTAALFTHIFENMIFQLTVGIGLLIIYRKNLRFIYLQCVMAAYVIVVITVKGSYNPIWLKDRLRFEYAEQISQAGYNNESKKILDTLSISLQNDPDFLTFYSEKLLLNFEAEKAITMVQKAIGIEPSSDRFVTLGKMYIVTSRYLLAESAFKTAIEMVPNRFLSRYELLKLYIWKKDSVQARICARQILSLPVKVSSIQVSRVRSLAKLFLTTSVSNPDSVNYY